MEPMHVVRSSGGYWAERSLHTRTIESRGGFHCHGHTRTRFAVVCLLQIKEIEERIEGGVAIACYWPMHFSA